MQFYQENGDIDSQSVRSNNDLINLITKTLSTSTHDKLIYKFGLHHLQELCDALIHDYQQHDNTKNLHYFEKNNKFKEKKSQSSPIPNPTN